MDTTKLFQLFMDRPLRGPSGSWACHTWERSVAAFKAEAEKLGMTEWEAEKLCREKRESVGTYPST
ncbi:MAG: hypothetical protein KAT75_00600 [Dehalococcoidia bacterium]|nr:hypothetical protein [Dehalococcoidia bacterium]